MSTRVRVVAFVLALGVVFLAARGVGAAVPPIDPAPPCATASSGPTADPSGECPDEHDEGHSEEQTDVH